MVLKSEGRGRRAVLAEGCQLSSGRKEGMLDRKSCLTAISVTVKTDKQNQQMLKPLGRRI